ATHARSVLLLGGPAVRGAGTHPAALVAHRGAGTDRLAHRLRSLPAEPAMELTAPGVHRGARQLRCVRIVDTTRLAAAQLAAQRAANCTARHDRCALRARGPLALHAAMSRRGRPSTRRERPRRIRRPAPAVPCQRPRNTSQISTPTMSAKPAPDSVSVKPG